MQFPCIECNKEVRPRQHAVACESCDKWQHRTCKTGISLHRYREAVQNGNDLAFVCQPCVARIPSRPDPVSESDISVNTTTNTTGSLLENVTFHIQTSLLSDLDSTDDNPPEPMDDNDSASTSTSSAPPTDPLNASFNISSREITDPEEIQETSMVDEPLSTSAIEEEPVRYELFEEGSKRGKPLLVGSDGFRYYIKKNQKNFVLWTCSSRSSKIKCYATVVQKGADYIRGANQHQHSPDPSLCGKVKMNIQVKKEAKRHVYKSATELVNTAMCEYIQPNQPGLATTITSGR